MPDEQVHATEAPLVVGGIGEHIGGNAGAHQLLQPTWTSSSVSGAEVAPSLTLGKEIDVDIWSNLLGQRFWDSSWHSAKPRSGMQEVLHLLQKGEKLGAAPKGQQGRTEAQDMTTGKTQSIHPSMPVRTEHGQWPVFGLTLMLPRSLHMMSRIGRR